MNDTEIIIQAGAIPFRADAHGRLEVLLIRRLHKKKWGIPKGMVDFGQSVADAAQAEAVEEAGAFGELSHRSVGAFTYTKAGYRFLVHVYLLRVVESRDEFPEHRQRERAWFPLESAVTLVRHPEVGDMIRTLPNHIRKGPAGRIAFVRAGRR